ncbi:MAG TPA: hypothetical protein VK633_01215, partial [Verrucomicrobiae bacterium]|nr:hypothetical protein [Verrucomicrobiae bacterium]
MRNSRLLALVVVGSSFFLGAGQSRAVDLVHVITLSLKLTAEGPAQRKGDLITIPSVVLRAGNVTFINSIADLLGEPRPARAQLLLLRYDVGEE